MGIDHERIHLETSAAIIRQLPIEKIKPSKVLIDCPLYEVERNKILINEMTIVPEYNC